MPEKVFKPETIQDTPFPIKGEADLSTSQDKRGGIFGQQEIKDQSFPTKKVAYELLASALNTKSRKILAEFEFTEHGAIQIGKYMPGVSGDLRITPNGITARDLAGITTFAIDGATGDAIFKGIVQAKDFVVVDGHGLASLANFEYGEAEYSNNQGITTGAYVDVTGTSLTTSKFSRNRVVLLMCNADIFFDGIVAGDFEGELDMPFDIAGVQHGAIYRRVQKLLGDTSGIYRTSLTTFDIWPLGAGKHTIKMVAKMFQYGVGNTKAVIYRVRMAYLVLGS